MQPDLNTANDILSQLAAGAHVAVADWSGVNLPLDEYSLYAADGALKWHQPPDLIHIEKVRAELQGLDVHYFHTIDSTNSYLNERCSPNHGSLCISEHQAGGRGRRQRQWLSPYARSLSISCEFHSKMSLTELGGLSSVVGVCLAQTLHALGGQDIELKWPNDVLLNGLKLSGILIELVPSGDSIRVVAGVGVNVDLTPAELARVDQPVGTLRQAGVTQSRTEILIALVSSIFTGLVQFEEQGFKPFVTQFNQLHAYHHEPCYVQLGERKINGTVLGVGNDGALRLLTDEGEQHYHGGEVSMRPQFASN